MPWLILIAVAGAVGLTIWLRKSSSNAGDATMPSENSASGMPPKGASTGHGASSTFASTPASASTSGIAGIDNNNPTNLRYVSAIPWKGQTGERKGFAVFDTALNGLRAAFINLWTGFNRDGINTVRGIITRLSPPNENPTQAYMIFVSDKLGVTLDQRLTYRQHSVAIIRAIVRFENGRDPYPQSLYGDAYSAAGKA